MKQYNHQYVVAFSLTSSTADAHAVSNEELLCGLVSRVAEIVAEEGGIQRAAQHEDTYELEAADA